MYVTKTKKYRFLLNKFANKQDALGEATSDVFMQEKVRL